MVTNISAKCKGVGVARFARRCWVLGSGCWRWLCAIGRICAELCVEGADSGRMQNWTNKAVIVGIKGVGVRRRLGLAGLAWMRTSPLGVGDAVWSRFLVATNGKRPGRLRGPAVEMRMGATRRLQRPRLSLGLICWAVRVSIFLPIKANFR